MKHEPFEVLGQKGLKLSCHLYSPENPQYAIQILHGMAEHSGRYHDFATYLTKHGFAVCTHDHRGHGKSINADFPLGHIGSDDGWQDLVEDTLLVQQAFREQFSDLPFALLGHSMGSFAVQNILVDHGNRLDAAVLVGSNGKPSLLANIGRYVALLERKRVGEKEPSPLLHRLSFGKFQKQFEPLRTESDWLSRDEAQVDAYISDPLCGFSVSTGTWITLLNALPKIASPTAQRRIPKALPVLITSGDSDPVGENGEGLRRLLRAYTVAGLQHVTIKLYEDGRHEILNDTNRQVVYHDIVSWLTENLDGKHR